MPEEWTRQLDPGSLLLQYETLYIVESFHGETVDVGKLGDREIKPSRMFDLEDDCPAPGCNVEIVKTDPGEWACSNDCLTWELNHPRDGEPCTKRRCEDGTIIEKNASKGQYSIACTDCERYQFGPEYWSEYWQPYQKGPALNAYRDRHPDIEYTDSPEGADSDV